METHNQPYLVYVLFPSIVPNTMTQCVDSLEYAKNSKLGTSY